MPITDQPTGRGVLYVLSTVAAEAHRPFSEWCDTIHHFDTMRIEGFLSLRRFELVTGIVAAGVPDHQLLTLYQVTEPDNADFSTESYRQHTATYTPPPDGVVDHITFEREVFARVDDDNRGNTQPVGRACVCIDGTTGDWLDHASTTARAHAGVLNTQRLARDDHGLVIIDVETVDDGHAVFAALKGTTDDAGFRALRLFEQVYPQYGVLVRDRVVIAPRDE
jgi:hypothetical protein